MRNKVGYIMHDISPCVVTHLNLCIYFTSLICLVKINNNNYYTSVYIFYIKLNADKITILHI